MFVSRNPATGELIDEYALHSDAAVERALALMHRHVGSSCQQCLPQRVAFLQRLAGLLQQQREPLAELISVEMGKLKHESLAEVDKSVQLCQEFANRGPQWLEPRQHGSARLGFQPLGIVLAVMPWNFPLWQVLRCAVPAWLAGNTVALKHATNVTGCAQRIAELVAEAANGKTYLQVLRVDAKQVEQIIADPRIRALHFTGSVTIGRKLAAYAASAGKRSVLELGGSDPFIVLPGADIEQASSAAIAARFRNAGQSCTAAKRLIVVGDSYQDFVDSFSSKLQQLRLGNPLDESTTLAPLARKDALHRLQRQLETASKQGAQLLCSGAPAPDTGWFQPAQLFAGIGGDSVFGREEIFGPIAAIQQVASSDEAVSLANANRYGLGASIWGEQSPEFVKQAEKIADQLQCGVVSINRLTRSEPLLPFGGVKDSGYGYELGELGLMELVTVKTILSL